MLPSLIPSPKAGSPGSEPPEPLAGTLGQPAWPRRLARQLALVLASVLMALGLLLVLALQGEPIPIPEPQAAQQYLSRTRSLIHTTVHGGVDEANQKKLELTADDLTAAANFLLLRKKLDGRALCTIENNRLKLLASIRLPRLGGRYLNLRLIADDAWPEARIKRFKLGRISLPAPVVGWLLDGALNYTPLVRYTRVGEQLIQGIRIRDGHLAVSLNWNRDLLAKAQGMVTDLADKERLLVYHDKLAELVGAPNLKRFVRLGTLMQPMFALAKTRSVANNDPIAENRALIVVLAAYVNNKNLSAALFTPTTPARRGVLLNKRIDTAQHFMGSASLAMAGHGTLVDMIGLAKEMHDTHSGSGFSFIDLAADQAGALFGKYAVRNEAKARQLQEILSRSPDEAQFMPVIKDLPENLRPDEFAERFKDIRSPEFQAIKGQIEGRIQGLPLYKLQ
jgi:hypothetical protein